MGPPTRISLATISFLLCVPLSAGAQFGTTASVERGFAATNREDPTASGTEIDLTDRPEANETAQDILPEIPGANVVSLGGPFDFVSLSLRGVDAENTTVLLGELPLSNRDTGAFDFSQISITAFERLEVYRGSAPIWLNNGSIGGVVRLIPREDPDDAVGANFGVGSFGTYRGEVEGSVNRGAVRSFNDFRYGRTRGDFPFTDDNCTAFVPSDDEEVRRMNNDAQRYQGLSFTEFGTGKGDVDLVVLGTHLERGIAGGCGPTQIRRAREARTQVFGATSFTQVGQRKNGKGYELQALVGGGYIRGQFSDPLNEVGIASANETDDRTANAYTRLGARLEVSDQVEWTILGTGQFDYFNPKQGPNDRQPSQRVEGAVAIEPKISGKWRDTILELRPSVRLGFSQSRIRTFEVGPEVDRQSNAFLPTIRVAGAMGPLPWLTIAASGFTGVRLPTILELFGTRALIRGNPNLAPESGVGADLSIVMAGSRGILKGSAEMRGFFSDREDVIVPVAIRATDQITFLNQDSARTWGAEARFVAEITRHLSLTSTLTGVVTRDQNGFQLASISPFNTLTRLEGHTRSLSERVDDLVAFAQFYYRAGGFSTPGEIVPFPSYAPFTVGAYALLFDERLWMAFTARNVNDDRSFDVLGYPLPGRNFAFEIAYRHRFSPTR